MRPVFATLLLALGFCLEVSAQVIVAADERSTLIAGLERTLKPPAGANDSSSDLLVSPFIKPELVQSLSAATEPMDSGVPELIAPVARRLDDASALGLIADEFRPIGSIVKGDRGMLQLASGGSISAGSSFNATIQDFNYSIKVVEVSTSGYVLQLGEASISRTFADGLRNSSSRITSNSTATPPNQ